METDRQLLRSLQLTSSNVTGFGPSLNIGTIAFDPVEELLWVGDYQGRITSYTGVQLDRYTSVQAHERISGPVLQFTFTDRGIVSISSQSVHLMTRRGLTQWSLKHPSMINLACILFIAKDSTLLVAGNQTTLLRLDAITGALIETLQTRSQYTQLRQSKYVCAATNTGSVDFLDPGNYQVVKCWQAHSASISGMEVSGNLLVTCGRATRPHGPAMPENLAKVYDLKNMQQLTPMSFPGGATFVQIHPKLSNTSIVGSTNGQLQVIDLVNPNTSNLVILGNFMTHFAISSSGNLWAIADQDNVLQLYGSPTKAMTFNDTPQLPEYADEAESVPHISFTDDCPLNTIGLPLYRDRLLSAWGNERAWNTGTLPPVIDVEVLRSMRPAMLGHIAPRPPTCRRNLFSQQKLRNNSVRTIISPKFLSQQVKAIETGQVKGPKLGDAVERLAGLAFSDATHNDLPYYYLNVEIKYGKYGVSDFDFRAYNQTSFSGLETDISNHYLNPLLQVLRFTPAIRNQALKHVTGSCLDETCLLCELGFLVDMLEKASGEVCQATNFLKTFSHSNVDPATAAMLDSRSPIGMTERLSAASRYLMARFVHESRKRDHPECGFEGLLSLDAQIVMKCHNCQNETYRRAPVLQLDLTYPDISSAAHSRSPLPRFSDVLKMTFSASSQSKGYCKNCKRYPQLGHRRSIASLPSVLLLDAALDRNPKSVAQLWSGQRWLPHDIALGIHSAGEVVCYEGSEMQRLKLHANLAEYELVGFVADIMSLPGQKSHPVAFVNTSISSTDPIEEDQWHLFNDFLVRRIDIGEALRFAPSWKTPVVLLYQMKDLRHDIDNTWQRHADLSCLYQEGSLNYLQGDSSVVGFPFQPGLELPEPGFHLAIDAEFVSLQQEEIQVQMDGSINVAQPVKLGTGRISALRGSAPHEGIPFIDDYIKVTEPIVDHLTQYSGLSAGDLDPRRSCHALQSLKVAYKKIWLLLNLGCIFVGHGLASDFRTINIHIPKAQIIDTVHLFRPENEKRRLSLRFLAWYFLTEEIQMGMHDSIVDARTALLLWRKYEEFKEQGVLDIKLAQIYRDGPNTGFKPPAEFEAAGGKLGRTLAGPNSTAAAQRLSTASSPPSPTLTADVVQVLV